MAKKIAPQPAKRSNKLLIGVVVVLLLAAAYYYLYKPAPEGAGPLIIPTTTRGGGVDSSLLIGDTYNTLVEERLNSISPTDLDQFGTESQDDIVTSISGYYTTG